MRNDYRSELSIEEFAHYSGRSLFSFKREFAEASGGETPARRIMRNRLDDAMAMLKEGVSASEVYVRVGFKNPSHVSTAFKKQFGPPPPEYSTPNECPGRRRSIGFAVRYAQHYRSE